MPHPGALEPIGDLSAYGRAYAHARMHDRGRFEILWGWVYRFEAYTPASRRKLGYYALPLLWRDRVVGWGNCSNEAGRLQSSIGYVGSPPRDRAFGRKLEAELDRFRKFLGLESL